MLSLANKFDVNLEIQGGRHLTVPCSSWNIYLNCFVEILVKIIVHVVDISLTDRLERIFQYVII